MPNNIILFVMTLSLLVSCSQSDDGRGTEIFPDMVHSVAYEAYSESTLTKDGKSMLAPVEGTIPRNFKTFHYGTGKKEAVRAGKKLKNPFIATKKTIARGRKVYENYCLVCHGSNGKGDGPIIPKFPNPPSFTTKRLKTYPDGRLYHIIMRGSGDMPSHEVQIDYKDRWLLIHYINELQK